MIIIYADYYLKPLKNFSAPQLYELLRIISRPKSQSNKYMMIQFTLAELQQLIACDPSSSLTDVQQSLNVRYLPSEVTAPSVPTLSLPQRIRTMTLGNTTYSNSREWNTAWLSQFESNIQQGLIRRQTRYNTPAVDKANVVCADGSELATAVTQPTVTPSGKDTTTIIELAPQRGAQGEPGPGVILVSVNEQGNLIVTYEDQSTTDAGYVIGPPPTLVAGSVTAVDYGLGAAVSVTEVGAGEYRLDFVTERGNFITDNLALTGTLTLNGLQVATQRDTLALGIAF